MGTKRERLISLIKKTEPIRSVTIVTWLRLGLPDNLSWTTNESAHVLCTTLSHPFWGPPSLLSNSYHRYNDRNIRDTLHPGCALSNGYRIPVLESKGGRSAWLPFTCTKYWALRHTVNSNTEEHEVSVDLVQVLHFEFKKEPNRFEIWPSKPEGGGMPLF
jgi:hypothetical protein